MKEALAKSASAFSGTLVLDCQSSNQPLEEKLQINVKVQITPSERL